MDKHSFFNRTFSPRPEAQAMDWGRLLHPVRQGVYELLVRIAGAVTGSANQHVANCFLVAGDRGTGKTTVLLSAKRAVEQALTGRQETGQCFWPPEVFQDKTPNLDPDLARATYQSARMLAEGRVVWLEVLDLLPLPKDVNLLTSLLTRLRDALADGDQKNHGGALCSLLEEGAEGARSQLARLLNDATLMWEAIHEPDTRNQANRQIAAADTYAGFRERFETAMNTLAQELGRYRGTPGTPCPIVLPIDNIDRSTDHLDAIVRLARIVSSPHLWLVLAGERLDVETFLERAYWKELITVGQGAIAVGRKTSGGEDEAFTMARRQAAAALHKLLPPSHRIELDLVAPMETLDFAPANWNDLAPANWKEVPTIRYLLSQVRVPSGPRSGQCEDRPDEDGFRLIHLFEPLRLVRPRGPCENDPDIRAGMLGSLSFAAQDALRLPARSVLDLWQVSYWAYTDLPTTDAGTGPAREGSNLAAERIARTMLRNVIAASTLPSRIARCLQDEIILRDQCGGTLLDFTGTDLRVSPLRAFGFSWELRVIDLTGTAEGASGGIRRFLQSSVEAHPVQRVVIRFSNETEGIPPTDLPPPVTGWLTVLYDILLFTDRVAIINPPRGMESLSNDSTVTQHVLVTRCPGGTLESMTVELPWPAPPWDSFLAHDLFTKLWEICRRALYAEAPDPSSPEFGNVLSGMAAMWVACALQTFAILDPRLPLEAERDRAMRRLTTPADRITLADLCAEESGDVASHGEGAASTTAPAAGDPERLKECLALAEQRLMAEVGQLYQNLGGHSQLGFAARERQRVLRKWLQRKLPLLLSQAYVPLPSSEDKRGRFQRICRYLHDGARQGGKDPTGAETQAGPANQDPDLVDYWEKNAAVILAPVDLELRKLLPKQRPSDGLSDSLATLTGALRQRARAEGGESEAPPPPSAERDDDLPAAFRALAQCLGLDTGPSD